MSKEYKVVCDSCDKKFNRQINEITLIINEGSSKIYNFDLCKECTEQVFNFKSGEEE